MLRVAVLLSVGRHPASGRARRAARDARALEMALSLAGPVEILAVHAGNPDEPALRDYLGMGLPSLTVLDLPAGMDAVPALAGFLHQAVPDLVLTGTQAEAGEDSGMVPYLMAEMLEAVMVRDVVSLQTEGKRARLVQALPGGRRCEVLSPLPVVASVPLSAPAPRLPGFVLSRAGRIETQRALQEPDTFLASCEIAPHRKRAARTLPTGSALDRLKAITEAQAGEGRLLQHISPDEAAREIRDYLIARGMLKPGQD